MKGISKSMQSSYQQYESSSGSTSDNDYDDDESHELILTPYATIEGELSAVFGVDSQYGQSLGVFRNDVDLIDGCLYFDPDKGKFKLFSWKGSNDMSPEERYERGDDPEASDANDFIRKTYAGNDKEYELVAARIPEVEQDGEVIIEASSVARDVDVDAAEYGEFEDLGGDTYRLPFDTLTWYSGSENGPSVSAREYAELTTTLGEDAIVDEDDINNWLSRTTGENMLREDLDDRRLRFFTVKRSGDQYTYNLPIIEDVETGARIQPDNRVGDSEQVQEAEQKDTGTYPEPVADFIQSAQSLDATRDRAEKLLDDMVSEDNPLTAELVEEVGGRDEVLTQAAA